MNCPNCMIVLKDSDIDAMKCRCCLRSLKGVLTSAQPDEDCCSFPSSANARHVPDWKTVHVESDGGVFYIDVNCKRCGRSGCLGTDTTLTAGINW